MYLLAIAAATRSIDLSAAYFVPDGLTRDALLEALRRGVALRIVVPGEHIDSDAVRATWGPLLQAGAVIAEYAPTMYHCKVMIVDGLLVSVGSTNFDYRSFRLNDEATLNILDAAFAAAQTAVFEADLALSRRVSHAEWARRPLRERLHQRLASLIGSQLRLRRRDAPSSRTPPRQSRPAKSHDRMRVCPAGPQQRWRQARRSYLRSSCKTSPEGNTLSAISNLSDVYNKQLRAAVKELYVADELMTELAEAAVNEDAAAE
jgi:hypothetical protein